MDAFLLRRPEIEVEGVDKARDAYPENIIIDEILFPGTILAVELFRNKRAEGFKKIETATTGDTCVLDRLIQKLIGVEIEGVFDGRQVLFSIYPTGQRREPAFFPVEVGNRHPLDVTGQRDEIGHLDDPVRLFFQALEYPRQCAPVRGVGLPMPAEIRDGLEIDSSDHGPIHAEFENSPDLVLVHPPVDGHYQRDGNAVCRKLPDGVQFHLEQIPASDLFIDLRFQAVELQIDFEAAIKRGQFLNESLVLGQADAVRVQHDIVHVLCPDHAYDADDFRMQGRFAAADLDDLGPSAFRLDQEIDHLFDLSDFQETPLLSVGITGRAIEIASRGDFDQADASMLLVLAAEPAIIRAAALRSRLGFGSGSRLVIFMPSAIVIRIILDQALERTMLSAGLFQIDFAFLLKLPAFYPL